jgi:metallo-beta-lactamase class B
MIRTIAIFATTICALAQGNPDWTKPFPAHRVIGNVYYVGTYDLACFLITTPKGNILINTGVGGSAPMIQSSIESLGFKLKDTKILLTTQAHYDHVAAMAEMKRLTGAKFLATDGDAPVLEDGGKSDPLFTSPESKFAPVKVDGRIKDGQKISLGGTEVTAYSHPGHTRGSASYGLTVLENGRNYRVLIANMGSINPGTVLIGNKKYRSTSSTINGSPGKRIARTHSSIRKDIKPRSGKQRQPIMSGSRRKRARANLRVSEQWS